MKFDYIIIIMIINSIIPTLAFDFGLNKECWTELMLSGLYIFEDGEDDVVAVVVAVVAAAAVVIAAAAEDVCSCCCERNSTTSQRDSWEVDFNL